MVIIKVFHLALQKSTLKLMRSFFHSDIFLVEERTSYTHVGIPMSKNISTPRFMVEFLSHPAEIKIYQIFMISAQQWEFQIINISLVGAVCNFCSIGIYWNVNGYPI